MAHGVLWVISVLSKLWVTFRYLLLGNNTLCRSDWCMLFVQNWIRRISEIVVEFTLNFDFG